MRWIAAFGLVVVTAVCSCEIIEPQKEPVPSPVPSPVTQPGSDTLKTCKHGSD